MSSQNDPIQLVLAEVLNLRDEFHRLGDEFQLLKESRDTRPILDRIYAEISDLKSDVSELKSDVSELKSLKQEIAELRAEMTDLKAEVADMKVDLVELKAQVGRLDVRVANVEARVKSVDTTFAQFVRYNLERQLDIEERVTRLEGRSS
jgi:chromosome segregation ATPase